jgi:hypothetical protein
VSGRGDAVGSDPRPAPEEGGSAVLIHLFWSLPGIICFIRLAGLLRLRTHLSAVLTGCRRFPRYQPLRVQWGWPWRWR